MTLHRQATTRSVAPIALHRMAGATKDWSAVSAYVRPADPATGGVVGISIMVGVVAVVSAMLACGSVL